MKKLIVPTSLVLLVGACGPAADAPSSQARVSTICDSPWPAEMIAASERVRLLQGMEVTREGVIAIVGTRQFAELSFDAKSQLAAAIDCSVAGAGNHLSAVRFRSRLHGSDLESFEAPDLLRVRERIDAATPTPPT